MIHKFWNVRLGQPEDALPPPSDSDDPATRETRDWIRDVEERMEEKVYRIWSVLSTFEESSAACISDMLLHVSNGAYIDGVLTAKRFIWHVEILFQSTDRLDNTMVGVSEKGKYRCCPYPHASNFPMADLVLICPNRNVVRERSKTPL